MNRTFRWLLASCGFVIALVASFHGQAKNRREALGEELASEMEAVYTAFLPGSTMEWEPKPALRVGDHELIPIDSSDFKCMPQLDGSFRGVAAFELGAAKSEYLDKLLKFEPVQTQTFPTTLVVFRMDSSHKVTELKRFDLETSGLLSKISILDGQRLPAQAGDSVPPLSIEYSSYIVKPELVAVLEWFSAFDTQTGTFRWRYPAGVGVKLKKNKHEMAEWSQLDMIDIFKIQSKSVDHLEIRGWYTGQVVRYACNDPCVVDAQKFFDQWLPLAQTSTGSPELQKLRDINGQRLRELESKPPQQPPDQDK